MATADSIAQEAQDAYLDAKVIAQNALTSADQALAAAASAVNGLNLNWAVLPVPVPTVAVSDARLAVPSYIPSSDFSNDVKLAFDERFAQLNNDAKPLIQDYLATFFPDIDGAVKTESDAWIVSTIMNGEFVPVEVEDALWNRARDREVQDALRTEESTIEASGARGFSTPSGLTNYLVAANQQDLSRRLQTINREIAVKVYEVANENTKFAIGQAIALRTAFVGALGNFINLATQLPNQAIDYAKTILAAKSELHSAAVNLYSRKIEEERLRTTVGFGNSDSYVKYGDLFINGRSRLTDAEIKIANVKADTAISAADTLSKVGAAAFATRNSMISVSAGV
jgi:hypothetical protein